MNASDVAPNRDSHRDRGLAWSGRDGTRALPQGQRSEFEFDVWVRRVCALVVAAVAAYASYEHQREFALHGGADSVGAALWPLSVDGLLLLATVGLLKPGRDASRRTRYVIWMAFLLGIAVSLAANIAAAPTLGWQEILVAGWPPVALLLSVELLGPRPGTREATATDAVVLAARFDREQTYTHGAGAPPAQRPKVASSGQEQGADIDCTAEGPNSSTKDELLERAREEDAQHRREFGRPISAETLRKRLRVGAARSRMLVSLMRTSPAAVPLRSARESGAAE